MKGLDLVILLFTAFLVAKGIWKGFVKEIAGIIAVLLAVIVSFLYHEPATAYFGSKFEFDYLPVATYVVLFVAVYAAVMLLGNLIDKILKTIFLGGINRILGGVFGAVKSALWLTILTYAYSTAKNGVGFQHPEWILDSQYFPFLVDFSEILSGYLA